MIKMKNRIFSNSELGRKAQICLFGIEQQLNITEQLKEVSFWLESLENFDEKSETYTLDNNPHYLNELIKKLEIKKLRLTSILFGELGEQQ